MRLLKYAQNSRVKSEVPQVKFDEAAVDVIEVPAVPSKLIDAEPNLLCAVLIFALPVAVQFEARTLLSVIVVELFEPSPWRSAVTDERLASESDRLAKMQ